jgi:hypothetical protein
MPEALHPDSRRARHFSSMFIRVLFTSAGLLQHDVQRDVPQFCRTLVFAACRHFATAKPFVISFVGRNDSQAAKKPEQPEVTSPNVNLS